MRMPDTEHHPDGEVIWSAAFPDSVGVIVGTNLWEDQEHTAPDPIPIRVRVTTEDGTGDAYLTVEDAYELVQALGNAITNAKKIERENEETPNDA